MYRHRYRQILRLQGIATEQRRLPATSFPQIFQVPAAESGRPRTFVNSSVAGAPGFEPGNGGIKIRCLTTWLRPIRTAGLPAAALSTIGGRTIAASSSPINVALGARPLGRHLAAAWHALGMHLAPARHAPERDWAEKLAADMIGPKPGSGKIAPRKRPCHAKKLRRNRINLGPWRSSRTAAKGGSLANPPLYSSGRAI
jgi:hypothetical protein